MNIYKVIVSGKHTNESVQEMREQIVRQEEKSKKILLNIGFSIEEIKIGKTKKP